MNTRRMRLIDSRTFLAGASLFVLGSGPLLAIIVAAQLGLTSDPNPNPIGPGILAGITFWPSLALMLAGAIKVRRANSTRATRS